MKTSFPETLCFATLTFLATVYALTPTTPIEATDDATFLAPSTTPTEAAGAQTLEAQPHEVTAQPVAVEPQGILWHDNYDCARNEAKLHNKRLLVRWTASWCIPCQALYQDRSCDPQLAKFVCLLVDIDQHPEWKVTGVPLEAIYDSTTMRPVCSGYNPLDLADYASHLEAMK